jgi:23S rRNA (adenine2030-N6)-methyltransferase
MLSYQHSYHAGNHADLLKHVLLGDMVAAMQQKPAPLFLFDAFASRGCYDLKSPEALKNCEFNTGIGRVWLRRSGSLPAGPARWFDLIADANPDGGFDRYLGSTALLAAMLREQDRLAACDLHPQEFAGLRDSFRSSRRLALHQRDAFEALGALLPPREKRGLVFLDPSYENKDEYARVSDAVSDVYPRFRSGVYVIWYPLLPAGAHSALLDGLKRSSIRSILRIELDGGDSFPSMRMFGSGLLIINPPWHGLEAMRASLAWIAEQLTPARSRWGWLVPE